jgi:squalene cyclase
MLRRQRSNGSWLVRCHAGPATTAHVTVALHFIGQLEASEARATGRFLEAQWRGPGGGFESYPGAGAADLGATAAAWAALHACGYDAAHPILSDARQLVAELGGEAALLERFRQGDLAALFLAMVGLFPATLLPLPPAALYVPGAEHAIEARLNLILPFTSFAAGAIVKRLRNGSGATSRLPWVSRLSDLTAKHEARRTLAYFQRFHNADGSWLYGDTYHCSLVLAAMSALGLDEAEANFYGGLRFLRDKRGAAAEEQRYYPIFESDVWPTAFALRALLEAGSSACDPSVMLALSWLCGCQRRGAWAFQEHNTAMPDCDDVGVVIAALAQALESTAPPLPAELQARVRSAVQHGRDWLRQRQNRDGGWASFQVDLPSKARGPMLTGAVTPTGQDAWSQLMLVRDAAPELGDPATEDVTARVLFGLGRSGSTVGQAMVDRGVAFLERQQDTNGGWWGRWTINYLAATAWVIRGLVAVRADLGAAWVKRGIRFLVDRQNADGGWGEDAASYRDLDQIGRGASTPGLTGLVVCALLEAGMPPDSATIEPARRYLVETQATDGSWPRNGELHALLPPRLFYELPETENQLPLEALGSLQRLALQQSARPARPRIRWSDPVLLEMYATTDAAADDVARELLATGELKRVNRMFRAIQHAGDPLPSDLPLSAREYFTSTAALPSFTDPIRLRLAHELFVRCGFAVATGLLCSSLPQCFAFPDGARALASTSSFQRGAERRVLETAQFVFDVAAQNGFSLEGRAVRAAQKVRLMHAAVRLHLGNQGWNATANGPPLNQRQLVGTMLAFSLVVTDALRALGFDVSDDEADAWFHLWRVTGVLLGISEQYLPATVAEGEQLMRVLRQRYWGASTEGTALTQATLAIMHKALPGKQWHGLPPALVRHLAGDACADLLELPRASWSRRLVEGGALLLGKAVPRGLSRSALVTTTQQVSFALMRALGELNIGDSPVTFQVPEELRRGWQPSL